MILVDANLLVYARAESLPQHERARAWLDEQLNGTAKVGLPWASILAFLRVMTNPRILERPEPIGNAWRQASAWLHVPVVWGPQPTEHHREVLGDLLREHDIAANLVPDTHLAALAIEHGLTLCSADGDYGRFTRLRWHNPLRGATG